ncbi:hypothetical protein D3C72_1866370 [compost metagenome]
MDWRAMWVICSDCSSHSLATRRNTMRLLYMMMKGVASMDSTMEASTGLSRSDSIRPWS